MDWNKIYNKYAEALYDSVIPFWEKHSIDRDHGGYVTCLLRDGTCYDTDKFIWLQARQVWTFAKLYARHPQKTQWLDIALHGAEFLLQHGRDDHGDWYFSLNKEGAPLVQAYNVFSDCFACLAFGQLALVTDDLTYQQVCQATYQRILERRANPKGVFEKRISTTRPFKNFALPMILANLTFELKEVLDLKNVESTLEETAVDVMNTFYNSQHDVILENVLENGAFHNSMDGRLVNPGHAIEAMSFVMDIGQYLKDKKLIQEACSRTLRMLEFGWDQSYGGLFYFLDVLGHPPQQLEWDQKLWWVHLESLVATIKGFALTANEDLFNWFQKIDQYTWSRFPDPDEGEWFGYLNRQGAILHPLKGGKWKGCFHVPRSLWTVMDWINSIPK